jgi:hypothetical protein
MAENLANKSDPKVDKGKTLAEEAVEQIKDQNTLFIDQRQEPYIAIRKTGGQVIKLTSKEFERWLRNFLIKKYKRFQGLDAIVDIVRTMLIYEAETGDEYHELNTRLCRVDDCQGNPLEIIYDTCDGLHAISITPESWSIQDVPIAFLRHRHQKPQSLPERHEDCSIELLRPLLSEFKDDREWLVVMAYICSLYIPNIPKPLLSISGDNGSGKTLTARRIVDLVECSSLESGLPVISNGQELMRLANKNAALLLDNLSNISLSLSDELCRICTGSSLAKRALYSDDDDWICQVCRPVIITGIPSTLVQREDLLDRTLPLKVSRISETKRRTQSELDSEFARLKPYLLGSIYNTLSKALKLLPSVKLEKLPRLADWYALSYAICESMDGHTGQEFVEAYKFILDRQTEIAVESSLVAQACRLLTSQTGTWEGTASQLHEIRLRYSGLADCVEDDTARCYLVNHPDWPRSPATLGKQLDRCKSTLESIGIKVKHGHYKYGQRWIELTDTNWKDGQSNEAKREVTQKSLC